MDQIDNFVFCKSHMLPQERVLWKGQPEKGNYLESQDNFILSFSVIWLVFSLYFEYHNFKSGDTSSALFGLIFVAIGLYLVIGRFIYAHYMRDKTFYVVTNKNLIIKKGHRVTIHKKAELPPMTLILHKDGNGTIIFQDKSFSPRRIRVERHFALENIPEPEQVKNAILFID